MWPAETAANQKERIDEMEAQIILGIVAVAIFAVLMTIKPGHSLFD
jgi:hypothetical protein